jgi:hypothetical protein
VNTRQQAGADGEGADHLRITTIDTRLATQHAATDDFTFQRMETSRRPAWAS